jgi:hypothetical protein
MKFAGAILSFIAGSAIAALIPCVSGRSPSIEWQLFLLQ